MTQTMESSKVDPVNYLEVLSADRRLLKQAHQDVKRVLYHFYFHHQADYKEIKRDTGNSGSWLGKIVRRNNIEKRIYNDVVTTQYSWDYMTHVGDIIMKMSNYQKAIIKLHYGEFGTVREKARVHDMSKSTYNDHVNAARDEFIALGGLMNTLLA